MLRLNLGSGPSYNDAMCNVDMDTRYRADLRCDVMELPFEASSVLEIHALHLIEHLPISDCPTILARWAELLCPGGQVTISGPDVAALTACASTDCLTPRKWATACFAWINMAPKGWRPPIWAESFHRPDAILKRAVAARRELSESGFVEWFNSVLFADGDRPREWYWLHRSAHTKATVAQLLVDAGLVVTEARNEDGRMFAVYGARGKE